MFKFSTIKVKCLNLAQAQTKTTKKVQAWVCQKAWASQAFAKYQTLKLAIQYKYII